MIGETLEQHCEAAFNQVRAIDSRMHILRKITKFQQVGSKGAITFRDFDETGMEYVSIMFEMKNQCESTASKHKNADFLKELDKDRREKVVNMQYLFLCSKQTVTIIIQGLLI